MSLILLADREPSRIDQLRSTLTAQGWQVRAVQSREQALQAASEQAPNLVLVDGSLAGARDLIRRFCRRSGGPGVILLADQSQEAAALSMPEAEWVLTKPLPSEKLIQTVREGLSQTKADGATPGPPDQGGRIYTSQDIFGDLLADIVDEQEAEPAAEAAAVGKGIQPSTEPVPASEQASTPPAAPAQRLGLHLDDTRPGARAVAQAVGAAGAARPAGAASQASSVDSLLEKTLSGLRLPNLRPRSQASASRPPLPWPAGVAGDRRPSGAQAAVPVPKSDPSSAEVEVKAMLEKTLTGVFLEDLERRAARSNTAPPAAEYAPSVTAPAAEPVAEEILSVPPGVVELPPLPPTAGQASPVYPVEDGLPSLTQVEKEATTEPPADGQEFVRELGDYGLEEKIGVGAMADVWKARRKGVEGFEKTVALKTILPHFLDNPDFVERFIDEAKLAAQLNHNNITQIYDLGKAGGEFFIAMEFIDGKDLRTILDTGRRRGKPLPVGFALLIASRISMALDYAHRKRGADNRPLHLVHRDVSPRNILISFEGEIKLCDFGIAKALTKASTKQIGELKGKLMYMSPEQARGKPADSRSDIFSAGAVLYEMLAGEPLF
ncbi:MAG: protein kinase, partial [Thermoanaerobaculia bacterium]